MTKNAARKRTIRALAEAEGISYTTALRKYGAETGPDGTERRPYLPIHLHGHDVIAFLAPDGLFHGDTTLRTAAHDPTGHQWAAFCDPDGIEAPLNPETRTARSVIGADLDLCPNCFGSLSDRRADAQLALLGRVFGTEGSQPPVEPLPTKAWALHFHMRDDMSMPLDLEVTTGGLVSMQSFWRGEKFQVIGLTDTAKAGRIVHPWREAQGDPSLAVGLYPVISDASGKWATWAEKVAEVIEVPYKERGKVIHATVTPYVLDVPAIRFRAEEFFAGLTDAEHRQLAEDDYVADARISGYILRAAIARGDEGANRLGDWATEVADADPEQWEEAEPFTVSFDATEVEAWRAATNLYPSQR